MSTRSRKRIHNSFHESTIKVDMESAVKSERKTRSTRLKENVDELGVSLFKAKKRNNYVSYPTDDEQNGEGLLNNDIEVRHDRAMRRNTLKELNNVAHNSDKIETLTEPKNLIRKSRRGKKTAEAQPENLENLQVQVTAKPKSKKNKKKPDVNPVDEDLSLAKKSKKKKKKINSMIVEEVKQDVKCYPINNKFNKSLSMVSFHSAAGSPKMICEEKEPVLLGFDKDTTFDTTLGNRKIKIKDSLDKHEEAMAIDPDTTLISKSIKNDTMHVTKMSMENLINTFVTDGDSVTSDISNNEIAKRESNINDGTFDKLTKIIDITFEKVAGNDKKDSTYDKSCNNILDTTFEETGTGAIPKKKKSSVKVDTFDTNEKDDETTIEKGSMPKPPKSAKKSLRKSNTKDTTIDKSEKIKDTTIDEYTVPSPQRSAKKCSVRKSSIKDVTLIKNEKVIDRPFERNTISTPQRSAKKRLSRQISDKDTTIDKNNDNIDDTTFEKDDIVKTLQSVRNSLSRQSTVKDTTYDKNENIDDTTFEKDDIVKTLQSVRNSLSRQSTVKDTTYDKNENIDDTTFEKDDIVKTLQSVRNSLSRQSTVKDTTYDKNENIDDTTFEKDDIVKTLQSARNSLSRQSSVKDTTYDKNENVNDTTFEKDSISVSQNSAKKSLEKFNAKDSDNVGSSAQKVVTVKSNVLNTTFENINISDDSDNEISNSSKKRKSRRFDTPRDEEVVENQISTFKKDSNTECVDDIKRTSLQSESKSLFDDQGSKHDSTCERNSKCSLISSDNSEPEKSYISCISITDDESEHLANTTPVLIESSMDNSGWSKLDTPAPQTPLKREGTFTKDVPEVLQEETPSNEKSLPLAGCTPYHVTKSSQKRVLNITRSIEKGRLSTEPSRMTRVMFCSPVDNPAAVEQDRRKIIKSNLKGSNKSFVFVDSVSALSPRPAARKRSYTHTDADDERVKRKRLADDLQQSVDRLSRPRTSSAAAKLTEPTPPTKKPATPFKSKSDAKPARTRLPNFSALHQRQFSKMESLGECQERKAKRARQLLTPNGAVNMLERISPKDTVTVPQKPKEQTKKIDTSTKLPTLESLRPGFTRFGFKLNLDVNPFSVPSKHPGTKPKPNAASETLPSLAGATSVRREVAKQAVMREKSFTDRRNVVKRNENRTIIKGVRTNRRFELQMKMRNVE